MAREYGGYNLASHQPPGRVRQETDIMQTRLHLLKIKRSLRSARFHPMRIKKLLTIVGLFLLAIMPFALYVLLLPEGDADNDPTLTGPTRLAFPYTSAQIQSPPTDFLPEAEPLPAEATPEPTTKSTTTRTPTRRSPETPSVSSTPTPPPPVMVVQPVNPAPNTSDSDIDRDSEFDSDFDSSGPNQGEGPPTDCVPGLTCENDENDPPDDDGKSPPPGNTENGPSQNQTATQTED